jgi:hypothetical protein
MPLRQRVHDVASKVVPAVLRRAHADHALRHAPSGLGFALAESIDHLRGDHWDALVHGHSVCLGRPFLRLLEESGPDNLKMHYAVVYRGAEPLAAVAGQSVAIDGARLSPQKRQGRAGLRSGGLGRLKQRVLVCGNLLGWGQQGVAAARGAAPDLVWHGVAEALYRIRRQNVLFGQTDLVLVKDLGVDESDADGPLRRFSYRAMDTEPNMVLALRPEWRGFDDYLAALRSDYRSTIRKQIRDVTAAGLILERLDARAVDAHAGALHALYLSVHERQRLRLVTIAPGWMPGLARVFGDGFGTIVIKRAADQSLVGFVTLLRDGDGAIGYYIGYDKALAEQGVPLYLRLLYALVEDAIAWRATWLSLGRTALVPKAALGAVGHPLRCYVRHRLPAMNTVVQALMRAVPEPDQPPERNPFKPGKPAAPSET